MGLAVVHLPSDFGKVIAHVFGVGHDMARHFQPVRLNGLQVLQVLGRQRRRYAGRHHFATGRLGVAGRSGISSGHFGGSMDAVAIGFPEAPKAWHVCEFKTHSAKSFAGLVKDGVAKSKPMHAAQMQVYMHLAGIERAFYLAVNKDTDELYQERLHYDAEAALRLMAKADRVLRNPQPPARISNDPAWYMCRFCDHAAACHQGAMPERHCRSCLHASPVADGAWHCARHNHQLDRRAQENGCAAHLYIPGLVHGEQVDAGEDYVDYRMPDGTEWRDGVPF